MLTDMARVVVSSSPGGEVKTLDVHVVGCIAAAIGTMYALKYVDMFIVPFIGLVNGGDVNWNISIGPPPGFTSLKPSVASGLAL